MRRLLFFLSLLLSIVIHSQDRVQKIDSIKQLLTHDTTNTKYINWLCVLYQTQNVDSAVFYGKKSVFLNNGKKVPLAQSYTNLGVSWWYKGRLDSAKHCFEKAIKIDNPVKDSLLWAKNNCNIAILEDDKGNYEKAIRNYEKGLYYFQQIKDTTQMYKTHSNIALMYENINEFQLSLKHNKIALNLINQLKNKEYLSEIYKNIGITFLNLKEFKQAKNHLTKGLKTAQKNKNKMMEASLLSSLGIYYIKKKEYLKAINKLKKSIALNKAINYSDTENESLINLSLAYSKAKQYKNANSTLKKIDTSQIYNYSKYLDYLDIKSEILYNQADYKNAYLNKNAYQLKQDSVKTTKFNKSLLAFQTQYETQQKENKILKQQNELQQKEIALQKERQKTYLYSFLAIISLLIGGGYTLKLKRDNALKLLNNSIKISEEEKTRIGRDLHDGIAANLLRLAQEIELQMPNISHKLLTTYNEIRGLSHQLNNTPMHGEVFIDRIFELIPKNTDKKQYQLQINPRYLELEEPIGTHIYRIVQELIANDLKHSNATQVSIAIQEDKNSISFNYQDNGTFTKPINKGKGLKNIEDRTTLLKGKLSINTANGFYLNLIIPSKKNV